MYSKPNPKTHRRNVDAGWTPLKITTTTTKVAAGNHTHSHTPRDPDERDPIMKFHNNLQTDVVVLCVCVGLYISLSVFWAVSTLNIEKRLRF